MANTRFEMHQFRHVLSRMRLGETDRQIAKARLVGRKKASELRGVFARGGLAGPRAAAPGGSCDHGGPG
jgi:hypothetical protein